MACKFCGSDKTVKNGQARGKQLYRCKDCKHQYLENGAFTGMRTKSEVVACALNLYYDGLSTWKVSRQIAKIFKVDVSAVAVWKWVMRFSELVSDYTSTLAPQLSGKYHHDETGFGVGGQDRYFWETIDSDTRYLVAHLLGQTRTSEEQRRRCSLRRWQSKDRPPCLRTAHSLTTKRSTRFTTRYNNAKVEWVRRVGIKARQTNNKVERLHGTLKDRLRPARGLKHDETAKTWLDGYVVNYNFVKPHIALKGKTPAQAAGLGEKAKADWGELIQDATEAKTKEDMHKTSPQMEVVAQ